MFRAGSLFVLLISLALLALQTGCDAVPSSSAAPTGAVSAEDSDVAKGLDMLHRHDRPAAEEQKVCPVCGDRLGAKGKPYKLSVKGMSFFLCSVVCEAPIRQQPGKYLANLNNVPESE